jgi:hypothetical protein
MASTVKPGTRHPSKPGLVMGTKGRYVAKSTYAKQVKAGNQPPAKTTPKVTETKTAPTKPATTSTPKVGATKRLQGRIVKWNGKRWTAAGTGPRQPTPTPRKADATPKKFTSESKFTAPKITKTTPKTTPNSGSNLGSNLRRAARTTGSAVKNVAGSLTAQKAVADSLKPVTDAAAKNIVRGAMKVTGQDTTNFDKAGRGKPVVKSVNGVDFNVNTEAGRRGYQKAIAARNQQAQGSRSGRGAGRAGFEVKKSSNSTSSSSNSKPKYPTEAVTKTIKKSRDYQAEAKANAAASKPKRKPSIKEAAYAKDARNKEYDRLRNAGKTKEAEALGRKIAGMKPKEAKENQKRTGGSRIANITLPKKKQSAANKAGYPGNKNY